MVKILAKEIVHSEMKSTLIRGMNLSRTYNWECSRAKRKREDCEHSVFSYERGKDSVRARKTKREQWFLGV